MKRRTFIVQAGAALAGAALASVAPEWAVSEADVKLEIAPLELEIAPGKVVHTVAYNGHVPGPLIRWPEGKPIAIDVFNRTAIPEIVHWHGLWIPSAMDGSAEEGGTMITPGAQFRYLFTPQPAGFRWYHTHAFAGHDLKRSTYTGQFGCFYIEPKDDAGAYDQEIFLTLHDWARTWRQRRLFDGSCVRIRNRRWPDAWFWRSSQGARGPTSALAYSECKRQPGSLAGARGTRNDRGCHGWQSRAHAKPGARNSIGTCRAYRCRGDDESSRSVDSWGNARPIAQGGHGNCR